MSAVVRAHVSHTGQLVDGKGHVTSLRALKRTAKAQTECDAWNAKHPVGTRVILAKDGGEKLETATRSEAQVLSGHSAVIWLDGVIGCYLLDRVTPIIPPDRPAGEPAPEAGVAQPEVLEGDVGTKSNQSIFDDWKEYPPSLITHKPGLCFIQTIPSDRPAGEPAPEVGVAQPEVLEGTTGGLPSGAPGVDSGTGQPIGGGGIAMLTKPVNPTWLPAWLVKEVQLIGVSPDIYRITFVDRRTKGKAVAEIKLAAGHCILLAP